MVTFSPPPPPRPISAGKLRNEIGVFGLIFGGLILGLGVLTLALLSPDLPRFLGLERRLVMGIPCTLFGLIMVAGALGLLWKGHPAFAILIALAATLFAVAYVLFMTLATGRPPVNLISLLIVAVPILIWIRSVAYIKARNQIVA